MVGGDKLIDPVKVEAIKRFHLTLELMQLAFDTVRQRIRRENPYISEADLTRFQAAELAKMRRRGEPSGKKVVR